MYIIKTKAGVEKTIPELLQQEIENAIHFNNIKKRQKSEQIEKTKKELRKLKNTEELLSLEILDLSEQKDIVQRSIAKAEKLIDDESYKQNTIEGIITCLQKHYDPQTHLKEYALDKLEEIQTED